VHEGAGHASSSTRVSPTQVNRTNPPASTPTEFYRHAIYLPLLNAVIADMQSCFSEETFSNLSRLTYFIPSIIAKSGELPVQLTDELLHMYGSIIGEPDYQFKLHGKIALWWQKWVSLTYRTDGYTSNSCRELSSLRQTTISFNSRVLEHTLNFASENSKCREKLFYASETQILDEVADE
jgi:hypothetical protein